MSKKEDRKKWYQELQRQATTDEAGELVKSNAVLMLWFFRHVVGAGEIDAYDFVCDGDADKGIDGLFLEPSPGDDQPETLVVYQSKNPQDPNAKLGPTDIDRTAGAANHFATSESVEALLGSKLEPRLRDLVEGFDLVKKLKADPKSVTVRIAVVTSGLIGPEAKQQIKNLRDAKGSGYVEVWTIDELGPLATSVRSPERIADTIEIKCRNEDVLIEGTKPNRVAVVPTTGSEIASWPGIGDRSLFALNVRHELAPNKVRKGLDRAIESQSEHRDFLAYHNGLTIVCDGFEKTRGKLKVMRPSVANGAQSVLAFRRGKENGVLTDDLQVFVKVVEVKGRPSLEREVSRRSNTQTRVSPRNLMANSGPQLRIMRQFEEDYPDVAYVTRPDVESPEGKRVIRNDDAAQWLCSLFLGWPWLAVKRESLFETENHSAIFTPSTGPAEILLSEAVAAAIDDNKQLFPEAYRSSWRLIRIVALFLVGQIAREAESDGVTFFGDPVEALKDPDLNKTLKRWIRIAGVVLTKRHSNFGEEDDYRKDLKNQVKLRQLGNDAVEAYQLAQSLKDEEEKEPSG